MYGKYLKPETPYFPSAATPENLFNTGPAKEADPVGIISVLNSSVTPGKQCQS